LPDARKKLVFAVPWDRSNDNPDSQKFVNEAANLWGTGFVSPITATTYDATKVLVHALESMKNAQTNDQTNDSIRKNLIDILGGQEFKVNGVTGPIQFHPERKKGRGDRREVGANPVVTFVRVVNCNSQDNFSPVSSPRPSCS